MMADALRKHPGYDHNSPVKWKNTSYAGSPAGGASIGGGMGAGAGGGG